MACSWFGSSTLGSLFIGEDRWWDGVGKGAQTFGPCRKSIAGPALFIGSFECVAGHHGGEKRAEIVLLEHCIDYGFFIKMPLKVTELLTVQMACTTTRLPTRHSAMTIPKTPSSHRFNRENRAAAEILADASAMSMSCPPSTRPHSAIWWSSSNRAAVSISGTDSLPCANNHCALRQGLRQLYLLLVFMQTASTGADDILQASAMPRHAARSWPQLPPRRHMQAAANSP